MDHPHGEDFCGEQGRLPNRFKMGFREQGKEASLAFYYIRREPEVRISTRVPELVWLELPTGVRKGSAWASSSARQDGNWGEKEKGEWWHVRAVRGQTSKWGQMPYYRSLYIEGQRHCKKW